MTIMIHRVRSYTLNPQNHAGWDKLGEWDREHILEALQEARATEEQDQSFELALAIDDVTERVTLWRR